MELESDAKMQELQLGLICVGGVGDGGVGGGVSPPSLDGVISRSTRCMMLR